MTLFLGVDPGVTGAVVAITDAGRLHGYLPASWERGSLSDDVFHWLDGLGAVDGAAIEEPIVFAGGSKGKAHHAVPKSAQAVAMSAGQWLGVLGVVGIRSVRRVAPISWQSVILGKVPRGIKGATKVASMRWASSVYGLQMENAIRMYGDGVADAACIAEWGRLAAKKAQYSDLAEGMA